MAADMFAPPVNRAMKVLDRSFFTKTVPTSVARIFSPKDISRCRKALDRSRETLIRPRIQPVQLDPDPERARDGLKCLVLRPEVLPHDRSTWSPTLQELERDGTLGVVPFELKLDYSNFSYLEIMEAIVPPPDREEHEDEIPTGFTRAGHVAHLNLRERYFPYKHLIGTVLADKNPTDVRTVINKVEHLGEENKFRVFPYEVLYGPDDLNVTLKEQDCTFRFDWAKGEVVCDVMAGVGPFAMPAGKKKCFVYANDLNPDSYSALVDNIWLNKVGDYVKSFNTDGHEFIRKSAADLLKVDHKTDIFEKRKYSRSNPPPPGPPKLLKTLVQPKTFQHYVMNLPASAVTFLSDFIGLYARIPKLPVSEARKLFAPHTETKLPMIHVYCFGTKTDDQDAAEKELCGVVSGYLESTITPQTPDTHIKNVREVSQNRNMYCVSFRLPEEVAFRES
ncbi:guanine(37)-N1-methyltransferase [Massarina eburnea CBS 473.64]|uniref:tRNA (guanine(37)-N1)-methyltransferase n=1 Tax=Massarina eburnea CBS 473.64 TaxID=1395130 RepID=A0A6A6RKE5_9PLEO|nr:guanine(37)-N1-methyltransferase [Massarina eburnea CBS 473.64]